MDVWSRPFAVGTTPGKRAPRGSDCEIIAAQTNGHGRLVARLRTLADHGVGDGVLRAVEAGQFREVCLRGLPTRVAHFDQPKFAWT